jgi:hypothetical protein
MECYATQHLCDAGLYHAAYGIDGFDTSVVPLSRRNEIANIVGEEAEAIVYLFCSCDRGFVFSNIGQSSDIQFKDRFTGKEFVLTQEQATQFCELTVANELELALSSEEFLNKHGKGLYDFFIKFEPFLTQKANDAFYETLSSVTQ